MTTFTTTIDQMYTIPSPTGYVVNVIYTVTGVDGTYTASIGGNSQFAPAEDAAIVPYDQLTEAEVLAWIPENQIASAQACVQGQLDSLANPPVSPSSQALPWSA